MIKMGIMSACVAMLVSFGSTHRASANSSVHLEQLGRIVANYRHASNGFHWAEASKKIHAAVEGFDAPIGTFEDLMKKAHHGLFTDSAAASTAFEENFRLLDAQSKDLESAITRAAHEDRTKISQSPTLDHMAFTRRAKEQQNADQELLKSVKDLVQEMKNSWNKLHQQLFHPAAHGS